MKKYTGPILIEHVLDLLERDCDLLVPANATDGGPFAEVLVPPMADAGALVLTGEWRKLSSVEVEDAFGQPDDYHWDYD